MKLIVTVQMWDGPDGATAESSMVQEFVEEPGKDPGSYAPIVKQAEAFVALSIRDGVKSWPKDEG